MHGFNKKIGVLGGGQLGKMLAIAAANWHQPIHFLDQSADYPAGPFASGFTEGDFNEYTPVYHFGKTMDVLTIEIEHVNTHALHQLKAEGVKVHPQPAALEIIKDKGVQKLFLEKHGFPTPAFQFFDDEFLLAAAISAGSIRFPFVQKLLTSGYDGRGVAVIQGVADTEKLLPGQCLIESFVPIYKELSVIVARNEYGQTAVFPPVEMEFNAEANLMERLICPADIGPNICRKAEKMAVELMEAFDICGLLAVEMFLDEQETLFVNEVAPRPHNSGHHTIESCFTSQFEQHLRAILNLPLGSTRLKSPSVMVNLLGEPDHEGVAKYLGLEKCLRMEGVYLHLYGKQKTKPYRKMGHATILDTDINAARRKADFISETIKIIA
jgi:5-(carboxyamino)imidazole ribonucleotide synthase